MTILPEAEVNAPSSCDHRRPRFSSSSGMDRFIHFCTPFVACVTGTGTQGLQTHSIGLQVLLPRAQAFNNSPPPIEHTVLRKVRAEMNLRGFPRAQGHPSAAGWGRCMRCAGRSSSTSAPPSCCLCSAARDLPKKNDPPQVGSSQQATRPSISTESVQT